MDDNANTQRPESVGLTIRWDDGSIAREAATLPDEIRDDYTYLKSVARDECGKDVDLLAQRMTGLGVDADKTTWAKIIRGRLVHDTYGHVRPHPVMSLDRFQEAVAALRSNVRAETLQGRIGFIETSITDSIWKLIDTRRAPETVNKWGVIVGPTGSGKSASTLEYQRRNNHGKTIHVEAPESGGMGEFITQIALRYGISAKRTTVDKRDAIFSIVTSRNTLIIDNAQELWVNDAGPEQPRFSFLRRLQDTSRCTVILLITPTFEKTVRDQIMQGYFEQFVGRTGGVKNWLRLPDYPPAVDCVRIAKAVGLQDAHSHRDGLANIAKEPGRIRRLFEDLQQAKRIAMEAKAAFTWTHVLQARGEL